MELTDIGLVLLTVLTFFSLMAGIAGARLVAEAELNTYQEKWQAAIIGFSSAGLMLTAAYFIIKIFSHLTS